MCCACLQVLALMLQLMAGRRAVSDRFYRCALHGRLVGICVILHGGPGNGGASIAVRSSHKAHIQRCCVASAGRCMQ